AHVLCKHRCEPNQVSPIQFILLNNSIEKSFESAASFRNQSFKTLSLLVLMTIITFQISFGIINQIRKGRLAKEPVPNTSRKTCFNRCRHKFVCIESNKFRKIMIDVMDLD